MFGAKRLFPPGRDVIDQSETVLRVLKRVSGRVEPEKPAPEDLRLPSLTPICAAGSLIH